MKKIGFAIVGSGAAARFHADVLREAAGCRLVGVYGAEPQSAKAFAEKYGIRQYLTPEELCADGDVRVVNICTPSGMHAEGTVYYLDAGKNVIVEKPLDITNEKCRLVTDAVKRTGLRCAVISQSRFAPDVEKAKEAIESGWLGQIVMCRLTMKFWRDPEYYTASPWRGTKAMDGGGALMNQGIHGVDLMRCLLGEATRVYGVTRTSFHKIEVEDTAVATVEFRNGAIGVIEGATSVNPGQSRVIEINGTKGTIRLDEGHISAWEIPDHPAKLWEGEILSGKNEPMAISADGHRAQFEDMASAILTGGNVSNDAESGARTVALIRAIYESAEKGVPISLE